MPTILPPDDHFEPLSSDQQIAFDAFKQRATEILAPPSHLPPSSNPATFDPSEYNARYKRVESLAEEYAGAGNLSLAVQQQMLKYSLPLGRSYTFLVGPDGTFHRATQPDN